jgi:putative DNA primase/helicase
VSGAGDLGWTQRLSLGGKMEIGDLVSALQARRSGLSWMARCPAHDDVNPSLSIREIEGKILLHCHTGCAQQEVIAALKARGLWETNSTDKPRIVAEYNYTDETGRLLYQVVRYDPKDFRQRYPDRHGGWIWKKGPRQVLYRLQEVLEAPIVFVVEGEKDAGRLRDNGFVATTNSGGAVAPWRPDYTNALRGREVILIPDNDPPGRQRVLRIARDLYGNVAKLSILELEGAKDISEWFDQGHSELELIHQIEAEHAV